MYLALWQFAIKNGNNKHGGAHTETWWCLHQNDFVVHGSV